MIDFIIDVEPLRNQGLDDNAIAEHLSAKTSGVMTSSNCKFILQQSGACLTDPVLINQRTGSLIEYYKTLDPASEQRSLIAWFLDEVFTGDQIRTNEYPISVQFNAVQSALPENLQPVAEALVESAGGRRLSVTVADIEAAKQAYDQQEADRLAQEEADRLEAEELQRQYEEEMQQRALAEEHSRKAQSLWNIHIAPLMDSIESPVTDGAVWQAALQTMANEWTA